MRTALPHCPDKTVKFVIGAPYNNEPPNNVKWAVDDIYQAAVDRYGKQAVVLLINEQWNPTNYQNYFACTNLDVFFHIGGEAYGDPRYAPYKPGQAFWLYNNTVLSYEFFENPGVQLNLTNTAVVLDTCHAFSTYSELKYGKPGLCNAITQWRPKFYSAGITTLAIFGSVEAYACFWKAILIHQAPLDQSTLLSCARQFDPTFSGNQAGLWLVPGTAPFSPANVTIKTNITTYQKSNKEYSVLHLATDEAIQNITFQFPNKTIACKPNPDLFGKPGITDQEFLLDVDVSHEECQIVNLNQEREREFPGESSDIYGTFPSMNCTYPYANRDLEKLMKKSPLNLEKYLLEGPSEEWQEWPAIQTTASPTLSFLFVKDVFYRFFKSIFHTINQSIDAGLDAAVTYIRDAVESSPSYFPRRYHHYRNNSINSPLFFHHTAQLNNITSSISSSPTLYIGR